MCVMGINMTVFLETVTIGPTFFANCRNELAAIVGVCTASFVLVCVERMAACLLRSWKHCGCERNNAHAARKFRL